MLESELMRQIQVAVSNAGARVFRNNRAVAWAGNVFKIRCRQWFLVEPGDVVIKNARPIHAGLCDGASDLIGWRSVKITEEMVGRSVAIFASIEVKTSTGRLLKSQRAFLEAVERSGGVAIVARSVEDALRGIDEQRTGF
jgi:hypothetical protein